MPLMRGGAGPCAGVGAITKAAGEPRRSGSTTDIYCEAVTQTAFFV